MFKDESKKLIVKTFSNLKYPLIVNSYGRSGSTILNKSIINNAVSIRNETAKNFVKKIIDQSLWNLVNASYYDGFVYKSHDYPPPTYQNPNLKMLYTFADPVDVVLSVIRQFNVKGENWIKLHYNHLSVAYSNRFSRIICEDQLRLEEHLDSWLNEDRIPIAFIRYESMWDYQDSISDFLGFKVRLHKFVKRQAAKEKNDKIRFIINENYRSLISKVSKLDNFFLNNYIH